MFTTMNASHLLSVLGTFSAGIRLGICDSCLQNVKFIWNLFYRRH
jgi:hypothetical protein